MKKIFPSRTAPEKTVAVVVESKMRRLSAEKARAAIASLPVFDAHDVRDDDVDECTHPGQERKNDWNGLYTQEWNYLLTKWSTCQTEICLGELHGSPRK